MGVRPPADDSSEAELIEFGIAALDAKLEDTTLDFPATQEEIVDAVGDEAIEYDASGHSIELRKALDRTNQQEFDSKRELLNQLHPVFEELRTSTAPGFFGWLRSLLP